MNNSKLTKRYIQRLIKNTLSDATNLKCIEIDNNNTAYISDGHIVVKFWISDSRTFGYLQNLTTTNTADSVRFIVVEDTLLFLL